MKIISRVKRGPAAGRRGRRAALETTGRRPEPEAIRLAVGELAALPGRLGLAALARDDDGELAVTIDPEAPALGEVLLRLLDDPTEAAATEAVREEGRRLPVLLEQRELLADSGCAARTLDRDLRDTELQAAADERALLGALYALLDELLDAAGPLSKEERDELAVDAGVVLRLREEERAGTLAERERTLAEAAEAEEEIEAAEDAAQLVETTLRLRSGEPVDAAALEQALRSFEALERGELELPADAGVAPPARARPRGRPR